jgi:hypothetical protein
MAHNINFFSHHYRKIEGCRVQKVCHVSSGRGTRQHGRERRHGTRKGKHTAKKESRQREREKHTGKVRYTTIIRISVFPTSFQFPVGRNFFPLTCLPCEERKHTANTCLPCVLQSPHGKPPFFHFLPSRSNDLAFPAPSFPFLSYPRFNFFSATRSHKMTPREGLIFKKKSVTPDLGPTWIDGARKLLLAARRCRVPL